MNNKTILFFIFSSLFFSSLTAQEKRDYQWIMGGSSSGNGILMDFNTQPVNISVKNTGLIMEGSNTSMCDKEGNLLFYSNACFIANADGDVMENGDGINPGLLNEFWCPFGGGILIQGVLSLPLPGSDSLYYVFNLDMDRAYQDSDTLNGLVPERLYFHVIDMSLEGGLGAVIVKNEIAIQDTFARSSVNAVRHANGVEWWIIVPKSHSNCYFISLFNSEGLQPYTLDCEGHVWDDDDSGQVTFSPDGTKYIRMDYGNGLNIMDFDDVTGDLSNAQTIFFPNENFPVHNGAAVSPNSRFLYVSTKTEVFQFDLHASDIESSKTTVAVWDGFANPSATIFNLSALGPDGKIYIASWGSTLNLHVIHKPDCLGLQCELEQHGINLPAFNYLTVPNLPHYRNEPTHINCDSTIITTTDQHFESTEIEVYPNPVQDFLNIAIKNNDSSELQIAFFNTLGQLMASQKLRSTLQQIDLSDFTSGVYFYKISQKTKVLTSGKIIKE